MFGLNTKNIGNKGEDIAAAYLKRKGYKIVDRNVYIAGGELDIVAVDNNILVFVEVKMRNNNSYGSPLESITPDKIKKIKQCAKFYISKKHCYNMQVRFDVIGIEDKEIEHIQDAFWLN